MICTHEGYQAISSTAQKPYKLTSDMPALQRYSAVFSWSVSTATSRGVFWWRQRHAHSNDEWVVCRVGKHQHWLAYYSSPCAKFAHTSSVKLNIMGIWEWGTYGLIGGWDGYGKVSYCFLFGNMLKVFRRVPFPVITWPQVLVPLDSWPVAYSHLDQQYKSTASISCTYPNIIFDVNSSSIIDNGF